ncbi:M90 family metallopeptidase [Neolewinella antarctica]|uniref:Peptidase n=1 Tax=Neolewinella antarctica TaxID=442734 RepID=A0ABX0X779_9BACT|nr:M90 family metallopeptidase [Neolewinella antarctica]NJC24997.1 hypothetical protein [Neolewinella antarctica]
MTKYIAIAVVVCLIAFAVFILYLFRKPVLKKLKPFPRKWRVFLNQRVRFYRNLDKKEKKRFQQRIQRFLNRVTITGIETEVTLEDRLLVAASGIIPTFGFEAWNHYPRLKEVLLYKGNFSRGQFGLKGDDSSASGMVGGGFLSGKLLLSRPSLERGFKTFGPDNVGIHEFVHLLDMADGAVDGVPEYFLENTYVLPWVEMMRSEMEAIERGRSDIGAYATTNKAEFLAVASEYFFSQPDKFAEKHPKIFALMEEIFEQDLDEDGGIGTVDGNDILSKIVQEKN